MSDRVEEIRASLAKCAEKYGPAEQSSWRNEASHLLAEVDQTREWLRDFTRDLGAANARADAAEARMERYADVILCIRMDISESLPLAEEGQPDFVLPLTFQALDELTPEDFLDLDQKSKKMAREESVEPLPPTAEFKPGIPERDYYYIDVGKVDPNVSMNEWQRFRAPIHKPIIQSGSSDLFNPSRVIDEANQVADDIEAAHPRDVCKTCKGSGSVPRRDPMRPILDKRTCTDCDGKGTVPAPADDCRTVPIECYRHSIADPHDTPCECGKCSTCDKKGCAPQNHAGWHPDDAKGC